MKLDKMVLANAFGLTSAIGWIICSAFVFLLPELSMTITGWWTHGLDLSAFGLFNLNWTNFLLGGITVIIASWIVGYIFGWSWERVSKKRII